MSLAAASSPDTSRSSAAFPVLLMVMFINILGFGVVVPLLPFYGQSFHAPPWAIALVFSAYSAGSFFGEPFWGRLSDRIGRRPILISSITANCACYLALAFAPNVFVAFAVRFLGGLAAGNGSVVQGYIADVTPTEDRAGRFSMLGAAYNVGMIIGPTLGGIFAHPGQGPEGFRIPLLIAAGLSACAVIGVSLFVRESRVGEYSASHQPSRWAMIGTAARNPVISQLMALTFVVGFAFTGIESTFGFWSQHRFGWGPRDIAVCFGITALVSAVCQSMITARLSRRYGEARMLAVGMVVTVVSMALQPFAPDGRWTIVLMTTNAIGSSVAFPNSGALMSRSIDPDHQGQIMGLNNALGALARVVGPFCAALIFSGVSFNGPFVLGALIVAPAIWLAISAGRAAGRLDQRNPGQRDF
ncbi:MAG TPA: MFS transporter [Caulobacteraceae bacterium]|nr:MFS transporter [Caulobacteraceae bacterium]